MTVDTLFLMNKSREWRYIKGTTFVPRTDLQATTLLGSAMFLTSSKNGCKEPRTKPIVVLSLKRNVIAVYNSCGRHRTTIVTNEEVTRGWEVIVVVTELIALDAEMVGGKKAPPLARLRVSHRHLVPEKMR